MKYVQILASTFAFAAEPKDEARASAAAWLKAFDAADYPSTWKAASEGFKAAVSSDSWSQTAKAVRTPLGQLKTRTERSATYTRSLPGAPDGEYVVIQFETVFENKAHSLETITAKREPDGNWKIAGYFVK